MEQPWPQPQEPAPDTENLPLAGLLAELLAASDTGSAPPPEGDPVAALALTQSWTQSEPESSVDAAAVLRALDDASQPANVPASDDLSGALMARLMAESELEGAAGTAAPVAEEICPAAPAITAPEEPASAIREPAGAEADAAAVDQPAALLARLLEEDEPAAAAETDAIVPDEPEMAAVGEPAGAEADAAAADQPSAPPAAAESCFAGEAEVSASAAPDSWPAPAGRSPAMPAGDEDEFELVDAAQAEKMIDRLLDAARSAIRTTQEPAPGVAPQVFARDPAVSKAPPAAGGLPPAAEPGPALAGNRPPEAPASIEEWKTALPAARAAAGEPWMREPVPRRNAEDRSAEASPIPPAAALMALGLPERLRARLESLGDVGQILRSPAAQEPALERKPRLLVFRAGGESYALSMECVREVERVSRVTPVPGAPAFVQGLVNLRGEILPLLDLAALFGRKREAPAPRLIVAQASSTDPVVALMVEELNGLAPFHETEVQPPPQPGPVRGSLEHRDRRVWWIDPVAVFGAAALEKAAGVGQSGGLEKSE